MLTPTWLLGIPPESGANFGGHKVVRGCSEKALVCTDCPHQWLCLGDPALGLQVYSWMASSMSQSIDLSLFESSTQGPKSMTPFSLMGSKSTARPQATKVGLVAGWVSTPLAFVQGILLAPAPGGQVAQRPADDHLHPGTHCCTLCAHWLLEVAGKPTASSSPKTFHVDWKASRRGIHEEHSRNREACRGQYLSAC